MIQKKNILIFLLMLFVCGMLGGVSTGLLSIGKDTISQLWNTAIHWVAANLYWPMGLSIVFLLGGGTLLFLLGRVRYKKLAGDPDADLVSHVDPLLDWGVTLVSVESIFMLLFYTIFMQYQGASLRKDRGTLLALFLFGIFASLLLELIMIRFVHKIHPGRKGDPLSLRYAEQWLQSCDELEKRIAYLAAYKTLSGLRFVLIALTVFLMLVSVVFPVGITPFLVIVVLWVYISASNITISHKLSKSGKVD